MKLLKPSISGLIALYLLLSVETLVAQAGSTSTVYGETELSLSFANHSKYLLDGAPVDSDLVPASLISLSSSASNIVWVEMEKGLLHLMVPNPSTEHWQIGFTRPISIGKAGYGKEYEGDNRTPVGLYHVTSFIADEDLIDFYGTGAFPVNYPNNYDKLMERTGYGIWLHGLPKGVDERPLLDSEGCVVIDNSAFEWLQEHLNEGVTRVLLGDQIEWASTSHINLVREEIKSSFDKWLTDWQAIDNPSYLSFYADNFSSFDRNLEQWIAYKNRIHDAKEWIDIDISDLNIFAYPGEQDLIVTEYYQNYRSSNFNATGMKQLFWRKQNDGSWKIIFEGAI